MAESKEGQSMENNQEFTLLELIGQLAEDPDLGDDPAQRAQIAFGLYGNLFTLIM